MDLYYRHSSFIHTYIHIFPDYKMFIEYFDKRDSFGDLKNEIMGDNNEKKKKYYLEMNVNIMDDGMILKDNGVEEQSIINVVRNDCIKINVEVRDDKDNIQTVHTYVFMSDLKIINVDKNKVIKVCLNNFILYFM